MDLDRVAFLLFSLLVSIFCNHVMKTIWITRAQLELTEFSEKAKITQLSIKLSQLKRRYSSSMFKGLDGDPTQVYDPKRKKLREAITGLSRGGQSWPMPSSRVDWVRFGTIVAS